MGRCVFLEALALEGGPRLGCVEFTVLNVCFFQNSFPVGLTSNPMYIQMPNSISNVSRKPLKVSRFACQGPSAPAHGSVRSWLAGLRKESRTRSPARLLSRAPWCRECCLRSKRRR